MPKADIVQDGGGRNGDWRGYYTTLDGEMVRYYSADEVADSGPCSVYGWKVMEKLQRWRDTINNGSGAERERLLREAGR